MTYRYGDRVEEKTNSELALFALAGNTKAIDEVKRRAGPWTNWEDSPPPANLPVDVQYRDGRIYTIPGGYCQPQALWYHPEQWSWRPMKLSGIEREEIFAHTGVWPA